MVMINNNLRIFIKVAESGSITQTSKELFISQPAVSKAVQKLEEDLQIRLFLRDKHNGLTLTDAGKEIVLLAQQMEDLENRIYQCAYRENNHLGGRVRIASMPIFTSTLLSPVIPRFREKYPDVEIEILEGTAAEIRNAVMSHQVDFGISSAPFHDLEAEIFMQDEIVAIQSSPFNEPTVSLDETQNFIISRSGHETAAEHLHISFQHPITVIQAGTVIQLVANGNGVGLVSKMVLDSTPNTLYRAAIQPEIRFDIGIVAVNLLDLTPSAQEFKRLLCDYIYHEQATIKKGSV